MDPLQQARLVQLAKVATDRVLGHAQPLAQVRREDLALGLQHIQQPGLRSAVSIGLFLPVMPRA